MTTTIFERFILDFERKMVLAGREKVILLVDNFSSHQIPNVASQLRIIKLLFLPPNTTSRFQPTDAGIIVSFKAHYTKLVIEHQLECIMAERKFVIDVYQAVVMVERTWRVGVTAQTIKNCWSHTNIFFYSCKE